MIASCFYASLKKTTAIEKLTFLERIRKHLYQFKVNMYSFGIYDIILFDNIANVYINIVSYLLRLSTKGVHDRAQKYTRTLIS